ncbi:MAG: thiazole synthase [Puniceicoccales bacterium]|jgi:thiazole synthase|nr:thiazole synthase [Puniceicoccales bacterium]
MLRIADRTFQSRLLVGTGKYASGEIMAKSLAATGTQIATVAVKRIRFGSGEDSILNHLDRSRILLLPNTSGARDAREAVFAAQMAREALATPWVKLEIHPDPKWLMPDPVETLLACEQLVKAGFVVLPYIHADPVLAKRLEDVGAAAVMPLGAPIGSNLGPLTRDFLRIIIAQANVPVIVDAGLGAPSHAAEVMELGADAVLINTALATASNPVAMSHAFKLAVEAGRLAHENGFVPAALPPSASPSSPLTSFLDTY